MALRRSRLGRNGFRVAGSDSQQRNGSEVPKILKETSDDDYYEREGVKLLREKLSLQKPIPKRSQKKLAKAKPNPFLFQIRTKQQRTESAVEARASRSTDEAHKPNAEKVLSSKSKSPAKVQRANPGAGNKHESVTKQYPLRPSKTRHSSTGENLDHQSYQPGDHFRRQFQDRSSHGQGQHLQNEHTNKLHDYHQGGRDILAAKGSGRLSPRKETLQSVEGGAVEKLKSELKFRNQLRLRKKRERPIQPQRLQTAETSDKLWVAARKVKHLAKLTHFSEPEVTGLIRMFRALTRNSSTPGELDRKLFRTFFQATFGITDDIMLDQIFHHFDQDNEGSTEEDNWIKKLSVIIRGTMDEQIKYCYGVYDLNGDGGIGREEITGMLQGCVQNVASSKDDDGVPLNDGEVAELILRKMDVNRTYAIGLTDFHDAVKMDPLLLQAFGETIPSCEKMRTFLALVADDIYSYSSNFSGHGIGKEDNEKAEHLSNMSGSPLHKALAAVNKKLESAIKDQKTLHTRGKLTSSIRNSQNARLQNTALRL